MAGFIILCFGFLDMSNAGKLTADMFWTFPLGSTVFYFPRLAEKLLKLWKGIP